MVTNFNWYYLMYFLAGDLKKQSKSFQISEPSLEKLASLKAADGTPAPADLVARLRTKAGEKVYTAAELKDELNGVLTLPEIQKFGAQIYDSLVSPVSSTPGRKMLIALIGGSPLLIGMFGCLLGGMLTDRYVRKTGDRKWGRRIYSMFGYGMAGACYLLATVFDRQLLGVRRLRDARRILQRLDDGLRLGHLSGHRPPLRRHRLRLHEHDRQPGRRRRQFGDRPDTRPLQSRGNRPGLPRFSHLCRAYMQSGRLLWLKIDASKPIVPDDCGSGDGYDRARRIDLGDRAFHASAARRGVSPNSCSSTRPFRTVR